MNVPQASATNLARERFGSAWHPQFESVAPGRLELLGNHIDYSGGLVLAGAIDRTVSAIAWQNPQAANTTSMVAADIGTDVHTVSTNAPDPVDPNAETSPADYLAGILVALHEASVPVRDGLQIVVSGDVPLGFGMSSSAALCVSLTNLLAAADLEDAEVVSVARRAEHLTGAPVGAMDQSASVAGGVILFDGSTGSVAELNPELEDYVFAVAHSGVHHALNQSAYPTRVKESQQALKHINDHTDHALEHLAHLSPYDWDTIRNDRPGWLDDILTQRVDHIVTEMERVRQGADAIQHNDWVTFGKLMTESGRSSATSYEISHPVVEELVSELHRIPGVLGARMMGGGEGGPALALVERSAATAVHGALIHGFFANRGLDPETSFEVCAFGSGASLRMAPELDRDQ